MEKRGLPSVLESFDLPDLEGIAREAFLTAGIPACRRVGTPPDTSLSDLSGSVPDFIDALTKPLTAEEMASGTYSPPEPPRIAMTGTYDEIIEFFEGDLIAVPSGGPYAWMTVGLPITPPTEERVSRMLTGTSHSPNEVFEFGGGRAGKLRTATIEKIAVNAVMAGCKPEYMPAVLAMAEVGACVGYPGDASRGHMYVVSGPYAKEIGMNSGFCFLESGNPANISLQHVCQLMGVNLGGCVHGITNLERTGSLHWGTTFAESSDTPWETMNVDLGYSADESILLSFISGGVLLPFLSIQVKNSTNLEEIQAGNPEYIVSNLQSLSKSCQGAFVLFTPDTAKRWKRMWGFDSIQELQDYFWDNTTWPAGNWYENYWYASRLPSSRANIEKREPGSRMINPDMLDLPPDTLIPMLDSPEDIHIIVAGGTGDAWSYGPRSFDPGVVSIDKWR